MNDRQKLGTSVNLGQLEDFLIGHAQISPSSCEVKYKNKTHRLQPRVMQVLVTLASLGGKVVTKEDLIKNCWGGAVVTDDAITRCIFLLRSVAEDMDGEVFSIKTVSRVGYALIPLEDVNSTQAEADFEPILKMDIVPPKRKTQSVKRYILLVMLFMGLVASFWLWRSQTLSSHQNWTLENYRSLTLEPDQQSHPAVSPDDKFVMYSSSKGSLNRDIWMRPASGGVATRITTHPDYDHLVSYSPDGQKIVFVRSQFAKNDTPCRIIIKDLTTNMEEIVARCKASSFGLSTPAWSPDGKFLFISESIADENTSAARLIKLSLDSGERTILTKPHLNIRGDFDPIVSPNGKQILFRRVKTLTSGNLFLLNLSNLSTVQLTKDDIFRSYSWTPDGEKIIALSSNDSRRLDVFSQQGEFLDNVPSNFLHITGRLARGDKLLAVETTTMNTKLINKFGESETEIVAAKGLHEYPAISKEGAIAFLTQNRINSTLWLTDSQNVPQPLTTLSRVNGLAWSPDNQKIAYIPATSDYIGIYDLKREENFEIPWIGGQIGSIAWAPEGNHLLFSALTDSEWGLWRVKSDGQEEAVKWGERGWWAIRANSYFVYASHATRPGIWRLSATGNPIERIEDSYISGQEIGHTIAARNGFAVTESKLYFHRSGNNSSASGQIFAKSLFEDSTSQLVTKLDRPFVSFDAGEDDRIVYVQPNHTFNITTMQFILQ